jgi:hypothetical protein
MPKFGLFHITDQFGSIYKICFFIFEEAMIWLIRNLWKIKSIERNNAIKSVFLLYLQTT